MTKLNIFNILIVTILMNGCTKKTDSPKKEYINALDGWEISKSKHGFEMNPRDIFFINSEIGFVVGYNGAIYKTTNSGESWKKLNSGTTLHLFSVFFLDENIGFVAGEGMNGCLDSDCNKGSVLLKTTNGGNTWSKMFFYYYTDINCLKFVNELKGLAIIQTHDIPGARDYNMAQTTDGGNNWEFINLAIKPTYDQYFYVNNIVYIPGENQKIYKSKDFGDSWETITTPVPVSDIVRNLYFYNENIGYIDGGTCIYKTTNGGIQWDTVNYPFSFFYVFHFFNESEGFDFKDISVYEGGDFPSFKGTICYKTTNGGASWDTSALCPSLYPGLTYFPQKDLGYGINGTEFYTIKKK
jgi:photosystem II stability/assembly factor-like uncharacterized protein